jgi:hypothetical protein
MTSLQIFAAVAAALVLLVCSTFLLPRTVRVERSAIVPARPRDVLALAASNEGYQRFNPYLAADPSLKIEPFGPSSGVGSGFRFDGKGGKGSQTVTALSDDGVEYSIDLGAMGSPTQRIVATPDGDGSCVVWTMETDLGMNPIARVFGLFLDGMMGKVFESGLNILKGTLPRA